MILLRITHDREMKRLTDRIEFLEEMVDRLTEHRVRVERKEAGLPEIAPERKPPREDVPQRIKNIIAMWPNAGTRNDLWRSVKSARDDGSSWEEISREMEKSIPANIAQTLPAL